MKTIIIFKWNVISAIQKKSKSLFFDNKDTKQHCGGILSPYGPSHCTDYMFKISNTFESLPMSPFSTSKPTTATHSLHTVAPQSTAVTLQGTGLQCYREVTQKDRSSLPCWSPISVPITLKSRQRRRPQGRVGL